MTLYAIYIFILHFKLRIVEVCRSRVNAQLPVRFRSGGQSLSRGFLIEYIIRYHTYP